jgi:hypothetical protein
LAVRASTYTKSVRPPLAARVDVKMLLAGGDTCRDRWSNSAVTAADLPLQDRPAVDRLFEVVRGGERPPVDHRIGSFGVPEATRDALLQVHRVLSIEFGIEYFILVFGNRYGEARSGPLRHGSGTQPASGNTPTIANIAMTNVVATMLAAGGSQWVSECA